MMRLNQAPRFVALFCGIFAALCGLSSTMSFADPPAQFMGLGDLPGGIFSSSAVGVSADGTTVVGSSSSVQTVPFPIVANKGFRWQSGTMTDLGWGVCSYASGASSDGSAIVGGRSAPNCGAAESSGIYSGPSGGGSVGVGEFNDLNGVSGDGIISVGNSDFDVFGGSPQKAMRVSYTAPSSFTYQNLGTLPGGTTSSARGISLSGNTVVGSSDIAGAGVINRAFRWTQLDGMVSLDPLETSISSLANAASSTGEVIVGQRTTILGTEAFRWDQLGGMVGLGDLPGGTMASNARAIDGQGWSIVGVGKTASGDRAFIWDPIAGMRELSTVLIALGADLTGWTLTTATGLSYDGLVVVGTGINPSGQTEAWRVVVPEPTVASLLLGAMLLVCRRKGR